MKPQAPMRTDNRRKTATPRPARAMAIWGGLGIAVLAPLVAAAASPLLAWREPVYIAAGFAGILAMILLVFQPLLAAGYLPGLPARRGRWVHRFSGIALVTAVAVHVAGLAITSPPDVVDALLFQSPTAFSIWGVIAMWAVLAAAALAALGGRVGLGPRAWRRGHTALAAITVPCSVVHALLIDGTMEPYSKAALSILALAASLKVAVDLKPWVMRPRR